LILNSTTDIQKYSGEKYERIFPTDSAPEYVLAALDGVQLDNDDRDLRGITIFRESPEEKPT
ncbi:MAG: hypothetical protein AAF394_03820, partial [Planctomycetota bacterium]